eukprot:2752312-Amphidinium_carterae.1
MGGVMHTALNFSCAEHCVLRSSKLYIASASNKDKTFRIRSQAEEFWANKSVSSPFDKELLQELFIISYCSHLCDIYATH